MTRHPLRVGVIGLGFVGRAHVDALRRVAGIRVEAVAGSGPAIVKQADALDVPKAYADYRELLADTSIDVIHNCTPNHWHFTINRAALEAGKACFAEKPLTLTSTEAAELVHLARARQASVAVNFNHRGFPQVQQARALVAAGHIGEVYAVHGSYLQDWLLHETDWNWRVDPEVGGLSRTVADIGSHWMDLAQSVSGTRIVEVMADLHTAVPVRYRPAGHRTTFAGAAANGDLAPVAVRTEDFASVLLRFANGAHGSFTVSQVSAGRKNRLIVEVDGARSALAWNSEDSERLWYGFRDDAARYAQRDPGQALEPGVSTLPAGHAEGWNDALRTTIAGFYDMLREGHAPKPWVAGWEDGWRAVALTEAILASHHNRQWTAVADVPTQLTAQRRC
jgi:predicted dehydrogenase